MEVLLVNEERLTRSDSTESTDKKRVRDEAVLDSPEVKRLRDVLYDVLDDSDPELVSQDLDSVMKSFEDELSASSSTVTTAQNSGETQPDLGYLLEASDDELGLPPPPPVSPTAKEEETKETLTDLLRASSDLSELWKFEDHTAIYDSLDLCSSVGEGEKIVAVDRLFETSDDCFDSGNLFSWRSESLPAQ